MERQDKEFTEEQYDELMKNFDSFFPKSKKSFTQKLKEFTEDKK